MAWKEKGGWDWHIFTIDTTYKVDTEEGMASHFGIQALRNP